MSDLQEFLKQDRFWPRHLRIAHAEYQFASAKTDAEKAFWTEVLKVNKEAGEN